MARRGLLAVLAVLGVAAVLWAARGRESDEALIRALLRDAARAAEERRPSDVVAPLSERFAGEGLDRRGAKQLVAYEILRGAWVSVQLSGVEVAVEGAEAAASVDAILTRAAGKGKALADLLPGEATAHRFALRLEREEDGWRVVRASWRPIDLADALAGPPPPAVRDEPER